MKLCDLIGLNIVAVKKVLYPPEDTFGICILFSDRKTFVMLEEQDYSIFHDCSYYARYIEIYQGEKQYKVYMETFEDFNEEL